MSRIFIPPGCFVGAADDTNQALDPCNCSSYYVLVTKPEISRRRQICDIDKLWNYNTNTCEPLETVLDFGLCDRKEPWDRCLDASVADKRKIKSKCIQEGTYNQATANLFMDSKRLAHILPADVQIANVELAIASMVAGSIITIMLIAIILTFCGMPNIKLPSKLSIPFLRRRMKRKNTTPPNITEGDNVSVLYEDIDDEDVSNTEYKPVSAGEKMQSHVVRPAANKKGPLPSPAILQIQVTSQKSSTSHHSTPHSPPGPPPRFQESTSDIPKPKFPTRPKPPLQSTVDIESNLSSSKGPKMAPRPAGSTPKIPQRGLKSAQLPRDEKKPMRPSPAQKLGPQQSDAYLHPVSSVKY